MRRLLALIVLLAVAVAASPADAKRPRHAKRLKAFTSCNQLVDYATRHVPARTTPPFSPGGPVPVAGGEDGGGPVPPSAPEPQPSAGGAEGAGGDDTSGTNTQEAGVGEPDSVKTDGQTVFALTNGRLHAVDAREGAPKLLGVLDLGTFAADRMFLRDGKVLALGAGPAGTRLAEIDVSDPAHMQVLRTQDVDGYLVDARRVGRGARVVVASTPDAIYAPAGGSRPGGRLAPDVDVQEPRDRPQDGAQGGPLPRRAAAHELRRERRAHRLHGRHGRRPPGRRQRRDPDRRRHGVRLADLAVRRHPALGRHQLPVRAGHDAAPLRHLGARRDALRGERLRSRARCSTSSRCPSRTASCAPRARASGPRGPTASSPRSRSATGSSSSAARSTGWARGSGSTRCASSATPATSSRSARPTRSTRST